MPTTNTSIPVSPLLLAAALITLSCASGDDEPRWPKRVTLKAGQSESDRDGLRLADGSLTTIGGDLELTHEMVVSLGSLTDWLLCEVGKAEALEHLDEGAPQCTGKWTERIYLSPSIEHTAQSSPLIGLGLLARNLVGGHTYRLRIVSESIVGGVATLELEYGPTVGPARVEPIGRPSGSGP